MRLRSHYQLTRLAVSLGAGSSVTRCLLRLMCRQHRVRLGFSDGAIDVHRNGRVIRISTKHFVYAPDMARRFDEYFGQVVPEERDGLVWVDYSYPHLQRYAGTNLEFEIASFPEETEAISDYSRWYRPQLGDTVFDVGAYCGVSAYHLSKQVGPTGKVYAFEPDRGNYSLLQRNVERHKLSNVVPLRCAVAGSTGSAKFCSEGALGSCLSRHISRATVGHVEEVPTITLQDACQRYGTPAFVKMDIEGSEVEVLSSAREFLKQHSIHFVLDTGHRIDGALSSPKVEQLFRECGYVAESSSESGFMATWARRVDSLPLRPAS